MKKNVAEDFVPFEPATPRSPGESGPRLKVVPKPDPNPGATEFAPLETPDGNSAGSPTGKTHSSSHHKTNSASPSISLERDGDRITTIRIECSCGQVIELSCSY